MLRSFLLSLLLGVASGPLLAGASTERAEHVPTASVQRAAWVPAGSVVTLTADCGDSWTFASDAATLRDSGFYSSSVGGATADKESCKGSWVSNGVVVEINVPKKLGESKDEWISRCKEAIDAALQQFPPTPPGG